MDMFGHCGVVEQMKKGICTFSSCHNLKVLQTDFLWTIDDFSKIELLEESVLSPEFAIGQCGQDAFGDYSLTAGLDLDMDDRGNVKLRFYIEAIDGQPAVDSDLTIKAHAKFSLCDGTYEVNDYHESPSEYKDCDGFGVGPWLNFMQRDQLLTVVKNDQLVIAASLTIYHHHRDDYQRQHRTLLTLYETQLGDFVIKCQGKDIKVPKKLLADNSPVMARMLESDMKEAKEGVLIIDDEKDNLDHETIESMIKYFYVGELLEDMDPAQLLVAAEKYQIDRLKNLCCDRLRNELTLENACEMLVIGDLYHADELKTAAMALICADPATAQATEGWQQHLVGNITLVDEVNAKLEQLAKKDKEKTGERKRKHQD